MVTLNPGQIVKFTVFPLNALGAPSPATLSSLAFTSSDETVFTVALDPSTPNGGIVTALTPASLPDAAVVTAAATATEPGGVTESITGTDTVTVAAAAPPPPPPATSLGFSWGTPVSPN